MHVMQGDHVSEEHFMNSAMDCILPDYALGLWRTATLIS